MYQVRTSYQCVCKRTTEKAQKSFQKTIWSTSFPILSNQLHPTPFKGYYYDHRKMQNENENDDDFLRVHNNDYAQYFFIHSNRVENLNP